MKLLSIVCFAVCVGLFVLALALRGVVIWDGKGYGVTLHVYTFVLTPRALVLTAIAFLIGGCVSAFAPDP